MSILVVEVFALYLLFNNGTEKYFGQVAGCSNLEPVVEEIKNKTLSLEEQKIFMGYACVNMKTHRLKQKNKAFWIETK